MSKQWQVAPSQDWCYFKNDSSFSIILMNVESPCWLFNWERLQAVKPKNAKSWKLTIQLELQCTWNVLENALEIVLAAWMSANEFETTTRPNGMRSSCLFTQKCLIGGHKTLLQLDDLIMTKFRYMIANQHSALSSKTHSTFQRKY